MQALAGEIADGCLTPSITTPPFVRYTRENVAADIAIGCTVVASIHASAPTAGRNRAPDRGARRSRVDRRESPREQGAELRGSPRHAARPLVDRAGRDPPCRRGDGEGR